jgi:FHS family L-fucose permease-like MFS transporter
MTNNYSKATLATLVSIYFFFGFVAASNNILIPTFNKFFQLSQLQSMLVDWAFYAAYFVGSFIYLVYSQLKGDWLNKVGYKNGLISGLIVSSIGVLFFLPASIFENYFLFLSGLFIIGLGFSIQQIVLNPFLLAMGSEETGAHRINIAGSINSIATMVAPIILSKALFSNININQSLDNLRSLIPVTLLLFCFFVLCIIFIWFRNVPSVKKGEPIVKDFNLFDYPQLILGIVGIFVYVGIEVSLVSNLGKLLMDENKLHESQIAIWISLYWGSLMIGRWAGSSEVFVGKKWSNLAKIILPFLAFGFIILVNGDNAYFLLKDYIYFIIIATLVFILAGRLASYNLLVFSAIGGISLLCGLILHNEWSVFLFISTGLYLSVLWPCIFEIATKNLGKYTNIGSSLLVMMIIGGGIIPLIQGYIADQYGIFNSYWVPLFGFIYLIVFGFIAVKKENNSFLGKTENT